MVPGISGDKKISCYSVNLIKREKSHIGIYRNGFIPKIDFFLRSSFFTGSAMRIQENYSKVENMRI